MTGGLDKILRIYDLAKPEAEPLKIEGCTQPIKTAIWTKDGNTIISAGQESSLRYRNFFENSQKLIFNSRIWDVRSLKEIKSHTLKNPVTSIDLSLDNKHITTSAGKEILFFDASR